MSLTGFIFSQSIWMVTRRPDPVVRWNRVEQPLMNALAALYDRDIAKAFCSMYGVITFSTEYYQIEDSLCAALCGATQQGHEDRPATLDESRDKSE